MAVYPTLNLRFVVFFSFHSSLLSIQSIDNLLDTLPFLTFSTMNADRKSTFAADGLSRTDSAPLRDIVIVGQSSKSPTTQNNTPQDAAEAKRDQTRVSVKLIDAGIRDGISLQWIETTFKNICVDNDNDHIYNVPVSSRIFDAILDPSSTQAKILTLLLIGAAKKHEIGWLLNQCYCRISNEFIEKLKHFIEIITTLIKRSGEAGAIIRIIGDVDISKIFTNDITTAADLIKAINSPEFETHFNEICQFEKGVLTGFFLTKLLNNACRYLKDAKDCIYMIFAAFYKLFDEKAKKQQV